jgi:xanthine dehydrogenase accessory factor
MKQAEFAKMIDSLASRGAPFAVATVVKIEGSSLGKPGFKVIISGAGEILYGSLGGVCPESAIVSAAKMTMRTGTPKMVKVFLEGVENSVSAVLKSQNEDEVHVETNCGGEMDIYIEPFLPQQRLILIGQGGKDDVEDALVRMGKSLEFDVVVIDHSPVLSEQPDELIKDVDYDLSKFPFTSTDSVVVLTRGERDLGTLMALSRVKLRYVGMLGSRQRVKEDLTKLREAGIGEQFITSLRAPIGADIGAVTATEIALSILTEIVATKYGKEILRKALPAGKPKEIQSKA